MNIQKLNALEEAIEKSKFQPNGKVFAGANLIISNDPARNRYDNDEFVLTPHAEEVSWVIFELKQVFADEIDYLTRLGFYPALGRAANRAILSGSELPGIQKEIVDEAKDFWSNRPIEQ